VLYLKRIEMQGFKSFADKITIEVEKGVTAIVGPNGSGKSNISDALRWVMGEQSAKSLRSGKMEDVIFNGTQKRKPLSFASVTLVLDNETHFFDSEYKELSVTRRVFRSGESEYLLNGAQCRLKDIHELFMDTGLGREGYSVVGQGRIDEIISSKSEDRRQVFEEAAGISKYRHRKTEAERKLANTEENLVRVRDVLKELEDRVEPLRKQSEKAKKYLSLRDELKGIEVSASVDIIDKNREEMKKYEALLNNTTEQLEKEKASLKAAEDESEALYAAMRAAEEESGAIREKLDRKREEMNNASAEKRLEENNVENFKANILSLEAEKEANEKMIREEEENVVRLKEEKAEKEKKLAEIQALLSNLEDDSSTVSNEMNERGREAEEARSRIRECEKSLSEAENQSRSLEMLKENIETRRFSIETDMTLALDSKKRCEEETDRIEREIEEEKSRRKKSTELFAKINSSAEEKAKELEDKKNEFNSLSAISGEKQGRLKMLEEMERGLDGYQRSVKDLITSHKMGRYTGKITGIFSKLITVPKEYATAIEVALGGAMQNVVVPNEQDAKEAVNYLKANKLGRVTFLPLSSQEKRRLENEARILSERGVIGIASDLVEREEYLNNTVESLLGRVAVCDNQDNAIALAKKYKYKFKIVTLTGEEFRVGGSITGGSMNRATSVLGRAEEIEELKKEVKSLYKRSEKAEDDIALLTDSVRNISKEREEVRLRLAQSDVTMSRLNAERAAAESRREEAKDKIARLEQEKSDISYKMLNNDELKRELLIEVEKAKNLLGKAEEDLKVRLASLSEAMNRKDDASSKVFETRMELTSLQKDIDLQKEREETAAKRIESLKTDSLAKDESKKLITVSIEKSKELIEKLSEHASILQKDIDGLEGELLASAQGKSGKDERVAYLREDIKKMNETVYSLQNEIVRLEGAKSKIDYNIENATNRLWDEYEMTYSAAKECAASSLSISEAQKRIASLKGAIRALGNINVDSIEEYRTVAERYEFLSGQVKDLDSAKASLEKLIKEIVVVMRDIFEEKFATINGYFGEIFKELFGGGHASVSLTDKNNILESGIEIEVQPPGKKLQSIAPLSGGEKALTAIALLFALMKVSPSPFVVLDEIEAALDDINVYRFAQYMHNRTDTTQFIVITHRRGTMESADVLYGVTMQEKGVSKLLSMRLEDVKEYQEV
jgi:chromosome segregation protein